MTDTEYFSPKYRDYISNSKLGLINPDEGGSPEKYISGFQSSYSDSFELGSAIHAMVLQPDSYLIADIYKPTGKLGLWVESVFQLRKLGWTIQDAITQASINADYYASKLNGTRLKTALKGCLPFYMQRIKFEDTPGKETIFLSVPMKYKFDQCMAGIEENPKMIETLYPQGLLSPIEFYNEYAILCEVDYVDTETGEITRLKLKGKLDNFTIDHESQTVTLNDLKSSGKPAAYFMGNDVPVKQQDGSVAMEWYDGSFNRYHYYRQLGMYTWLLQCAVKQIYGLDYQTKANILVIETIPEFKSKVCPISGNHITAGLVEFKNLLTEVVKWTMK